MPDIANSLRVASESIVGLLDPILKYTLGEVSGGNSEIFFVKVLVAVLILSIVYLVVRRMPLLGENNTAAWVISTIVAILGARFLSSEALINFVWLPSGALGIALTSFLPLVIYFLFIESFHGMPLIRRAGWIFFALIFFALSLLRWDDLLVGSQSWWQNLGWVYFLTALLALVFAIADGTVQRAINRIKAEKILMAGSEDQIIEVKQKLNKLPQLVANNIVTQQAAKEMEARYKRQLAYLSR